MKIKHLRYMWIGNRILKTGIAVFITAAICLALNLPAVFAVITAIVTLEPTTSDSLKKGIIRLPASAIGAALAVFFVSIFGLSPYSFTLAAVLTIFICQKLKLEQGTLVATITAVAMIPGIHDHFFLAFLTRLGTTTIGLTVSTLVNLFLLPPNFIPSISARVKDHRIAMQRVLTETVLLLTNAPNKQQNLPLESYHLLRKNVEKTFEQLQYQKQEWKYHRYTSYDYKTYNHLEKEMHILQKTMLHIGNVQFIETPLDLSVYEKNLFWDLTLSTAHLFSHIEDTIPDDHFYFVYELDKYFKFQYSLNQRKNNTYFHHFDEKIILCYELLSIHDTIEELNHLHTLKDYDLNESLPE